MKKAMLFVLVGIATGYFIGFSDARTHHDTVVKRMVDRAGGKSREHMPNDVDAQMDRLEKK
jgi:hypothetical protein